MLCCNKSNAPAAAACCWCPLGLIVLLFECVPLVSMFVKAFSENGHFSLAQFGTIAHQLVYRTAIINSLWVTLLSTAVGLVIDFFLALALYGDHGRKKTLYLSLLNLTSTFSGVPLTIAFITMMGTSGVLVLLGKQLGISLLANYNLYSMTGMFIIYAYFQIPMGTLLLLPTVDKVRREWKEAARPDERRQHPFLAASGHSRDDAGHSGHLQYAVCQRGGRLRDAVPAHQ